MIKHDDGGFAFPGEQGHIPNETWNQTWDPGMSLWDYYAGQATEADIETYLLGRAYSRPDQNERCQARGAFADAMIAEKRRREIEISEEEKDEANANNTACRQGRMK